MDVCMKMEVEIRATWPRAEEWQELLVATGSQKLPEGIKLADNSDLISSLQNHENEFLHF